MRNAIIGLRFIFPSLVRIRPAGYTVFDSSPERVYLVVALVIHGSRRVVPWKLHIRAVDIRRPHGDEQEEVVSLARNGFATRPRR